MMKKILKIIGGIFVGLCILLGILVIIGFLVDTAKNPQPNKSVASTSASSTNSTNTNETKKAPPIVRDTDLTDNVSIESQDLVNLGNNRGKATVVVKNNSNITFNYVRVDIYFYDESGNVVGSAFTNSGNSFLPNATQTLTRTLQLEDNYYKYNFVVTKVS